MPLPLIMAVGAGIGALAGVVVYSAKVIFSKKTTWNWRDAGAHAIGGLVGGGLFPVVMAGLGAAGLPSAAAYVVSGGLAWGGIWTLAQDAASWALGRRDGMASPKKYLISTAIGMAVSAALLPLASRAIGPGLSFKPHSGTTSAYLSAPRSATDVLKAEGEFLAYGALNESADAGITAAVNLGALSARGATELLPPAEEIDLPSLSFLRFSNFDRPLGLEDGGSDFSGLSFTHFDRPLGSDEFGSERFDFTNFDPRLGYFQSTSTFGVTPASPKTISAPEAKATPRAGLTQALEGK